MSLKRLGIYNVQELIDWSPPPQHSIISNGILDAGTNMILFGEAGSWKSVLGLHTANCIATGSDWFGYKTSKSVVFRYQAELPMASDRERTLKYMNSHRPAWALSKTEPDIKLDTTYGKSSLDNDLAGIAHEYPNQHIVLILDPVMFLMGGHISDEYDVKKLLHDTLNSLRKKYLLSVILIHHPHKTRVDSSGNIINLGYNEIFGSVLFQNWASTIIQLDLINPKGSKDKVKFTFNKHRNAYQPLYNFSVKWSREDLHPSIYNIENIVDEDDITTKGLV